jgi:hypothetical protein
VKKRQGNQKRIRLKMLLQREKLKAHEEDLSKSNPVMRYECKMVENLLNYLVSK